MFFGNILTGFLGCSKNDRYKIGSSTERHNNETTNLKSTSNISKMFSPANDSNSSVMQKMRSRLKSNIDIINNYSATNNTNMSQRTNRKETSSVNKSKGKESY